MMESRFDVIYGGEDWWRGPYMEHHFCREWDEEHGGCYGTNPHHGFSFEQAKQFIIAWWEEQTEESLFPDMFEDGEK